MDFIEPYLIDEELPRTAAHRTRLRVPRCSGSQSKVTRLRWWVGDKHKSHFQSRRRIEPQLWPSTPKHAFAFGSQWASIPAAQSASCIASDEGGTRNAILMAQQVFTAK